MIDLDEKEIAAMQAASAAAGEYIESLGRTDMAAWSEEEWMTLVEVIVGGFFSHLKENDTGCPF